MFRKKAKSEFDVENLVSGVRRASEGFAYMKAINDLMERTTELQGQLLSAIGAIGKLKDRVAKLEG